MIIYDTEWNCLPLILQLFKLKVLHGDVLF